MARQRKSALDSVLEEIQNSQPSLQDMLKAKAASDAMQADPAEDAVPEQAQAQEQEPASEIPCADDAKLCPSAEPVDAPVDAPQMPEVVEQELAAVSEPMIAVTIEEQYAAHRNDPVENTGDLDGMLKGILGVPKSRTAVPTLVRYRQDGQLALRGVIIDIGEYELTEGWKLYKTRVEGATPERYLLKVYELTQTEIPRMYRTVGEMRLE